MESSRNFATYTSQQRFSAPQCPLLQKVTVGCPKELNQSEYRVGLTPQACLEFVQNHHTVVIETGAGLRAGFTDEEYSKVGCKIVKTSEEVYKISNIIIKVLAPEKTEFQYIRQGQIVMAFFNFNHNMNNSNAKDNTKFNEKKVLFENLLKQGAICIDYENIENNFGMRPLVQPMSEIAGHLSVQQGMKYLEKQMGGSGVLLGNIAGVKSSRVLILGAGVAGVQAARLAASTGSHVTLMDISTETLRQIKDTLPSNVHTLYLSEENINGEIKDADLVIGAVIPQNNQFPRYIVNKKQVEMMKRGSVIVDLAMWWGGNFESSHETTIEQPTYMFGNVIHFCATNIWSSVPKCASEALSAAVLPFALQIANKNWQKAALENGSLLNGMTLVNGSVTNEFLSQLYNTQYEPIENLFKKEIQQSNKHTSDLIQLKQQLQQFQSSTNKTQFTIEA